MWEVLNLYINFTLHSREKSFIDKFSSVISLGMSIANALDLFKSAYSAQNMHNITDSGPSVSTERLHASIHPYSNIDDLL